LFTFCIRIPYKISLEPKHLLNLQTLIIFKIYFKYLQTLVDKI